MQDQTTTYIIRVAYMNVCMHQHQHANTWNIVQAFQLHVYPLFLHWFNGIKALMQQVFAAVATAVGTAHGVNYCFRAWQWEVVHFLHALLAGASVEMQNSFCLPFFPLRPDFSAMSRPLHWQNLPCIISLIFLTPPFMCAHACVPLGLSVPDVRLCVYVCAPGFQEQIDERKASLLCMTGLVASGGHKITLLPCACLW